MNEAPVGVRWHLLVIGASLLVAWLVAKDHAGAWNDGSRLATVESLIDRQTWAIDDSVFVRVPPRQDGRATPYWRDDFLGMKFGTLDKLWINGHFYSDKSPVPALLLAGEYLVWRTATGCCAADRLDSFCKWLTFGSSGLAYALAVWCIFRLGGPLRLALPLRLGLTASFAVCTVALAYARYVNNHILLLAATAALLVELVHLSQGAQTAGRLLRIGAFAGLAYTIDLGAGPVLLLGAAGFVVWTCRRAPKIALFTAAALPFLVLHHALNYSIGGTLKPANAVAQHFEWPGCPFSDQTLTGTWNHANVWQFAGYALELLVGKKGFLLCNLPLLLSLPAAWVLLRRREGRALALLCVAWSGGVWLLYAAGSTNAAGVCCSIRWFLPLLAPGWYLLAVYLRDHPRQRGVFVVLCVWGGVLGMLAARGGAWMPHMIPGYWFLVGGAMVHVVWQVRATPAPTPDERSESGVEITPASLRSPMVVTSVQPPTAAVHSGA
jgi:hypothetical protein